MARGQGVEDLGKYREAAEAAQSVAEAPAEVLKPETAPPAGAEDIEPPKPVYADRQHIVDEALHHHPSGPNS
jgi:hypothetical protein